MKRRLLRILSVTSLVAILLFTMAGIALAAIQGLRGGKLWVLDAQAGAEKATLSLESPPVFDGMAVAAGRLYITTMDGTLSTFGPAGPLSGNR